MLDIYYQIDRFQDIISIPIAGYIMYQLWSIKKEVKKKND